MELQLLNKEELTALYQNEMTADFPRAELKPLRAMLRLMDMGRYDPLLVTDGGRPVGYALAWLPENRKGVLLEYFGVLRGLRNGGLGARILALLAERYGQIFGEAEKPNSDDPAENDLRRRRIAFYERNGFRVLDYECALFGVHFNCLYRGPEADDRKVEAMHRAVYAGYFSPAHMERYIQLPLRPGEAVKPAPEWVEEAFPPPLGEQTERAGIDMDIILANRTAETAAIYFEKTNNEAIRKLLPQKAKTVEEAVADFHASQLPGAASYGRNIWTGGPDGQYVGDNWCYCIDPADTPGAMVSYCVFEQALWGQGIASRALSMFLPEITRKYGLKTVGAFTFSHNLPSIRVLEKNGFRLMEELTEDGVPSRYYQLDLNQEKA